MPASNNIYIVNGRGVAHRRRWTQPSPEGVEGSGEKGRCGRKASSDHRKTLLTPSRTPAFSRPMRKRPVTFLELGACFANPHSQVRLRGRDPRSALHLPRGETRGQVALSRRPCLDAGRPAVATGQIGVAPACSGSAPAGAPASLPLARDLRPAGAPVSDSAGCGIARLVPLASHQRRFPRRHPGVVSPPSSARSGPAGAGPLRRS
jgi:hypothetical protein